MRLEAAIYSGNIPLAVATAEDIDVTHSFNEKMEACLLSLCKQMRTPIPIWMKNNTRELARYHQTLFTKEQFLEPVVFERYVLRVLDLD